MKAKKHKMWCENCSKVVYVGSDNVCPNCNTDEDVYEYEYQDLLDDEDVLNMFDMT